MISWVGHLRATAIIGVILLHVAAASFINEPVGSMNWLSANFYDSLSRWCVPLFVMISGTLLLDNEKNESIQEFYNKRASKILIPTVAWTLIYLSWLTVKSFFKGIDVSDNFVKLILNGEIYYHLWYVYMLVGLYAFTPFIRKLVISLAKKELEILLFITFFLSISNEIVSIIFEIEDTYFLVKFLSYVPYFIFGHYIFKYPVRLKYLKLLSILLISFLCTFSFFWVSAANATSFQYYFYNYLSINVVVMSVTLFIIGSKFFENKKIGKIFSQIEKNSFGVYLIHPIYFELSNQLIFNKLTLNDFLLIPLVVAWVLFLSTTTIFIIRKSYYLRKIV